MRIFLNNDIFFIIWYFELLKLYSNANDIK